ncbi:YopX family protein [Streptococcus parasanguinis]|uniref:YopX family protein n=1 Tax=Streptococcus parasanguinis TaxID=1318 RepID=UPI0004E158BB|nr:YopX family protein [Streptococcus parasanguinis]
MIPKYRAWDKELQTMLDVSLMDFKKRVLVGEHWKFGETNFISFDDIELMQSTGLFDKNGKEVFVGDIIKCTRGCPHEVYLEKEYAGTFVGGMPAIYLKGIREGYAWTGDEEILGNIYENTELLEEKQ